MILQSAWINPSYGATVPVGRGEKGRDTSTHSHSLLPGNAWASGQSSPHGCFTLRAQGSVGQLCIACAHLYRLQNKNGKEPFSESQAKGSPCVKSNPQSKEKYSSEFSVWPEDALVVETKSSLMRLWQKRTCPLDH